LALNGNYNLNKNNVIDTCTIESNFFFKSFEQKLKPHSPDQKAKEFP
jgi:hypothetical protein